MVDCLIPSVPCNLDAMSTRASRPYVSIGMPVFNGERFLGRAIDTLLEQEFENFELLATGS